MQQLNSFMDADMAKDLLKFKPSIGIERKLSDFEHGNSFGARQLVWIFQKLLIYTDFLRTAICFVRLILISAFIWY